MSEPSEELPLRRIETDTVIESRWSEADGFPLPLKGLIDLTQISRADELFADKQNQRLHSKEVKAMQ